MVNTVFDVLSNPQAGLLAKTPLDNIPTKGEWKPRQFVPPLTKIKN